MLRLIAVIMLGTCILTPGAHADLFLINLQGTAFSGDTLQVTGTIDMDLGTDLVLSSELMFFHESDPGIPLPHPPTVNGSGIDFVFDMNMLFVETGAATNANTIWSGGNSPEPSHCLLLLRVPTTGTRRFQCYIMMEVLSRTVRSKSRIRRDVSK